MESCYSAFVLAHFSVVQFKSFVQVSRLLTELTDKFIKSEITVELKCSIQVHVSIFKVQFKSKVGLNVLYGN